jgi:rhamnosyltransferase subunit B
VENSGTRRAGGIELIQYRVNPARRLNVLLATLGSAGDVHPFIALGSALRARGHRATILTNPFFRDSIEAQGLGFLPVGTIADVESAITDPNLWHPNKGFEVVAKRVIIPSTAEIFRIIEKHADADTVVAASSIAFGARLAQEKLGLPTASVHLQPTVIRSLVDQGMFGTLRISRSQPMWFKRALFRFIDWAAIDRLLRQPLNDFRATLGLSPVTRVLARWIHSPQCVIGFFPDWFAPPQSDWPPNVHLVGFPLWDGGAQATLPEAAGEARDFLAAGDPPVIVTPGSAASTMQGYFVESTAALHGLGLRGMLITNFPGQLPAALPPGIKAFGYLPFSEVLPGAALLVYHGGIGTLAQAIKAGVPQLVVPSAHDQFDNGWRVARLGMGRSLPRSRYRAVRAASEIRAILSDRGMARRSREGSARVDSAAALGRACDLIEGLKQDAGAPCVAATGSAPVA